MSVCARHFVCVWVHVHVRVSVCWCVCVFAWVCMTGLISDFIAPRPTAVRCGVTEGKPHCTVTTQFNSPGSFHFTPQSMVCASPIPDHISKCPEWETGRRCSNLVGFKAFKQYTFMWVCEWMCVYMCLRRFEGVWAFERFALAFILLFNLGVDRHNGEGGGQREGERRRDAILSFHQWAAPLSRTHGMPGLLFSHPSSPSSPPHPSLLFKPFTHAEEGEVHSWADRQGEKPAGFEHWHTLAGFQVCVQDGIR